MGEEVHGAGGGRQSQPGYRRSLQDSGRPDPHESYRAAPSCSLVGPPLLDLRHAVIGVGRPKSPFPLTSPPNCISVHAAQPPRTHKVSPAPRHHQDGVQAPILPEAASNFGCHPCGLSCRICVHSLYQVNSRLLGGSVREKSLETQEKMTAVTGRA